MRWTVVKSTKISLVILLPTMCKVYFDGNAVTDILHVSIAYKDDDLNAYVIIRGTLTVSIIFTHAEHSTSTHCFAF